MTRWTKRRKTGWCRVGNSTLVIWAHSASSTENSALETYRMRRRCPVHYQQNRRTYLLGDAFDGLALFAPVIDPTQQELSKALLKLGKIGGLLAAALQAIFLDE